MVLRFRDVPLSNFDLIDWCRFLGVPLKGVFSRDEARPLHHSPCIINLDDFGRTGTHWVCCWPGEKGEHEYFDSFGLPPPLEWERKLHALGHSTFLRNTSQIQSLTSVRCGYYCLLFLNERNRGTPFRSILRLFSPDVMANERLVKKYFSSQ